MNSKIILIIVGVLIVIITAVVFCYFRFYKNNFQTKPSQDSDKTSFQSETSKFPKSVFFIHHSTGEIYWNGGMKKAFENAGYIAAAPWWDGNTNPQDFYQEFKNNENWKILEPYSIIIFKSCFPASDINSDEMLNEYKENYIKLYEIYRAHPNKLFVPLSTPPLLQNNTTPEAAKRALAFENWLATDYKKNYNKKNLAPFKLHALLSDENGYLKSEFIASNDDDHPNNYSGEIVGSALVEFLKFWTQ